MNEAFKDHFSGHADLYARYRPTYPRALFDWLACAAPGRGLAWDCGTGSGQAAVALAERFDRVVATDASAGQLSHAFAHERVEYRVEPAERSSLEAASVDLVFVSQALHWFDVERFYAEVRRVLSPGGLIVAVTFRQLWVDAEVEAEVEALYRTVADHWPPERRHVEQAYASLPFPFEWIETPQFVMRHAWRLADLSGYLATWSASRRYLAAKGSDPVADARARFTAAWGDPEQVREVRFPLVVLAGRVVR